MLICDATDDTASLQKSVECIIISLNLQEMSEPTHLIDDGGACVFITYNVQFQ